MENKQVPTEMKQLLKRPEEREDVRITTYLESELYEEVMRLKKAGISVKKVVNEAVADLLKKYNIL
ncbi:hypothetical protein AJ85_17065 [Alkalihalobacillus alcalophilus ATCC 27647 = CGMCC 1.3604]|uniref:CopG family transcriptional regulator n=1 Tax=Alkalihalobacillus alcalophilus ATCC 27647 = CGMCC 1.3604 TaxID=1218173 RepID=A0A094WHI9_ALKAL|nr:hypothetical protein [Alkalihalobacillus alcalophilus]KGA97229.1 hypothetical protein BALCAV_0211525 [Alkalihalobacillus alcalophilus ATCC 27647 = CGMCC 1.3604]MED1561528.1 hypothetical protein [Alkalihalobacillus alcalophilus]THG89537.1 hypothetical protein AJ85_17065 [Alkalihalobacillus alcalophilus ATCC 27647 = CGMCC 1.3604]